MGFFICSGTANRATVRFRELLKATDFVSRVSNGFREEVDLDWKDLEARWASDFGETEECRKRDGKPGNGFIQGSGESRVRNEKENVGGCFRFLWLTIQYGRGRIFARRFVILLLEPPFTYFHFPEEHLPVPMLII